MILLWSDEFNGAAGSSPSAANWVFDLGSGWDNGAELQTYTNLPANASLNGNGQLAITALSSSSGYTSARIKTKGLREFKPPVRIEASIAAPNTPGLLPAFWMLGDVAGTGWPAEGEIDIAEWPAQFGANSYACNMHGPTLGTPTKDCKANPADPAAPYPWNFLVYGVNWYPDHIDWTLGTSVVGTVTQSQYQAAGGDWTPFSGSVPFYVILNIAVGNPWTGQPTSHSVFPQSMLIDYVRAYSL